MKQLASNLRRFAWLVLAWGAAIAQPASAGDYTVGGLTYTIVEGSNPTAVLSKIEAGRGGTFNVPVEFVDGQSRVIQVTGLSIEALNNTEITTLILTGSLERLILTGEPTNNVVEHIIVEDRGRGPLQISCTATGGGTMDFPKLKTMTLQRNMTSSAVVNYPSFSKLSFGSNMTEISTSFAGPSLKELIIPSSVEYISGTFDVDSIGAVTVNPAETTLYMPKRTFDKWVGKLTVGRHVCERSRSGMPSQDDKQRLISGTFPPEYFCFQQVDTLVLSDNLTEFPHYSAVESLEILHLEVGAGFTEIPLYFAKRQHSFGPDESYYSYITAKLRSVVLGENVEKLNQNAFAECGDLKSIYLPDNLRTIGAACFAWCISLEKVELGSKLETIGNMAFYECSSLAEVKCKAVVPPAVVPPAVNTSVFRNIATKNITVPFGSKADYQRAEGWPEYFDTFIQETPENPIRLDIRLDMTGDLLNHIDVSKAREVYGIKVAGPLNGTDILVLNRLHNLEELDLSEATIVSGGQPYYTDDNRSWHTEADKLLPYWLNNISPKILSLPKVKEISDETFLNKTSLVKVKMPDTVEKIGRKAFYECSNLTEIDLSTSLLEVGDYAFAGCTSLTGIKLSTSLLEVGSFAFEGCTSLLSVEFPSSADRMGNYIFNGCSALSKVVLHEGMKQIPTGMFSSCRSLKSIELPSTITYTAYNSFYNTGLREIVLPKVMTEIGQQSFYECDSLSKVTMPESLKVIGPTAFSTTGITEIVLPSDIESIGNQAFAHTKIREVTIPVSLKKLSRNAFGYIPTLKTLIIEDSPEDLLIGSLPGTDGYYLEKLHVGRPLTPSEQRDFGFGSRIEDLSFSDYVTDVNMLFSGCTDLKKLVLPESVRSITAKAFANTGLTDVYVMNTTPPTMSENTFSQSTYNTAVLHVKPEVKTDYWLHMYWGQFMNIEGDAISDSGVSAPTADKDCMTVSVAGRSLQVGGIAEDAVVTVYNIAGKIVFRGSGRTVDGLEAGIYIVRAGDLTCKAMIR